MKHKLVIAGGVLVAVLSATAVSAQRGDFRSQSFKVGSKGTLVLEVESGDIVIDTGGSSEVMIQASRISDPDRNLEMWQRGDTVHVEYRTRSRWGGSAHFEVTVPQGFNIEFSTSGANVELRGNLSGSVNGRTSGGDIEIQDVDGEVSLKTSGGDLSAGVIKGPAELRTSGGEIKVARAGGSLDVKTSGGDLELGDVGGFLEAKTSGGSIRVGNVAGEADVGTSGGDIEVGIVTEGATLKTAGGDISLEAANGAVIAKTAGGDIELRAVTGSIEAKTAGGDILARLTHDGESGGSMASSGGDIILYLTGSGGMTIEAHIKPSRGGGWNFRGRDRIDIFSDFEASSYERDDESLEVYAVYEINGGGPLMKLTTTQGRIEIKGAK